MFLSTKPILCLIEHLNNAPIFNFSHILLSFSHFFNKIPTFHVHQLLQPSSRDEFAPFQTLHNHQTEQPPPIDEKSSLAPKNVNYSIFQDCVLSSARSVTCTSDRIWLLPSSTRGKHQRPLFADAVGA